jgi:predicted enzyme related to lactoylglutathione lyase
MGVTPSRVVRHDLMSTDQAAAARFYSDLFGWKPTEISVMGFKVVRLSLGEQVLGAVMPFDPALGHPSHWVPYMYVESVDACCKKTGELGGNVCMGGMEIPPGRFALVNDPQGAIFSPFTPKGGAPAEPPASPAPGAFCWDELLTNDPAGAKKFYTSLFGWGSKEWDMGPGGTYTLLQRGEQSIAGIMKMPSDASHRPMWLPYVAVADADAAAARAEKLGAKVAAPPNSIPDVGRMAVLADPTGASIAILAG